MASAEVQATIDENLRLSAALGLSGTPSYVIGAHVLQGAVGLRDCKARSLWFVRSHALRRTDLLCNYA